MADRVEDPATLLAGGGAGAASATPTRRDVTRLAVVAGFAAVYLIWGSTYLAIRVAIESLPAFLMAGVRFFLAGAVLYVWARRAGADRPTAAQWKAGAVTGALMLLCGNGGVVYAQRFVPSGLAALLVTTVTLWMALLDWLRPGGKRPGAWTAVGLLMGLGGVVVLVGLPGGGMSVNPWAAAALVGASLAWAIGSIYSNHAPRPTSPLLGAAVQLLAGGALLFLAGLVGGETRTFDVSQVRLRSVLAFLYLAVAGSLVAYTVYTWLLRVSSPTLVSTYAFVNPVVAVVLGWAILGETLAPRQLVAGAVVVGAVALMIGARLRKSG